MESNMNVKNVANAYKQTDEEYIDGIETAHGRIKFVFQTLIINLDNLLGVHPKTDFISFGKCQNSLKILVNSLDPKQGKDLAENLGNLYAYCSEKLKEYLEDKNEQKLIEIRGIISGLLEAWEQIGE